MKRSGGFKTLAVAAVVVAAIAVGGVFAFRHLGFGSSAAATDAAAPPPEVGVVTVKAAPRLLVRELPGRIAPSRVADVRPRVSGIIVKRLFTQGSDVKEGEPLYQIDPRPFEVELQANDAAKAKASSALELATLQANRSASLAKARAIPEAQNEEAIAAVNQARADLAGREADVARAKLDLEYATIRAPIAGRIGAALVTEGALVVQHDATNLATIQQLDPVYADFTQSVAELSRLRRALEAGELTQVAPDTVRVQLVLDDGVRYPIDGKLLFSDAKVDPTTDQVTLRGEFANPRHELLPGMYVRVLVEQGINRASIAVPQQAMQRNAAGAAEVFVVRADDRIAIQSVHTGDLGGGQWTVLDGLKPGDRVVVDGFQKFAAGDVVKAVPWTGAPTDASPAH